ncbi:hypothetical protein POVWA2_030440 [Plasmodium ovale wallikeri]|uniref:Uncharacterized protein n=1 Tax=Plasmodium ovale wallikeri TaxID=864142 RepID=A0A1A8YX21_PLAOA|nr:hypothetical protein POVWA1_030850 [Plasmodium ovale wallikeri]SBT36475.1 hypothetical protein POVWA2_030440 [Plasmodium ovale wallikeri]
MLYHATILPQPGHLHNANVHMEKMRGEEKPVGVLYVCVANGSYSPIKRRSPECHYTHTERRQKNPLRAPFLRLQILLVK